jgi:nicotinamide phosphoribosyltransferase
MQNAKGGDKVADFEYEMFVYLLENFQVVFFVWTLSIWRAITEYCVKAKDIILARDGKLVIRPDSGDPVDILCGLEKQ